MQPGYGTEGARTLEKNWEAALCEQQKLLKDYQEFQRTQPLTLSDEQRDLIRHLAEDIPVLWSSPTTTPQDRQQIVRMLVERIELNIRGTTEQTQITIFWAGGFTSQHHFRRSVISYSQSSSTKELIAYMVTLYQRNDRRISFKKRDDVLLINGFSTFLKAARYIIWTVQER